MECTNETNREKKINAWEKLVTKYKYLEPYCKMEVNGLDDDSLYYHPKFCIDENVYITSQADVGTHANRDFYAITFNLISTEQAQHVTVDMYENLLDSIIMGYHTNKDIVIVALTALGKVREHVRNLENYTIDYVSNILIGNSIKEITQNFKNELSATEKIISFLQKSKK